MINKVFRYEYLYKIYNRDIVKEICDVRDELIYLGPKERRVKIGTFDMLIMHGDRDSKTGSSIKMEKYGEHAVFQLAELFCLSDHTVRQ